MITYNWVISQLDTAPQSEGLTDVVKVVHWRYVGEDADYRAEIYSTYSCPSPSETDFTAYPDLTEAQVISWLEAGLDVQNLKDGIDAQIENLKNPPIITLPLPWSEN